MNSLIERGLIDVRVFALSPKGGREVDRFASPCPPRVGDRVGVQYQSHEVLRVEWWVAEMYPTVHVYVDIDTNQ